MVHLLKMLVNRESPTQNKKAVDACSAYVINEFKKVGAKITRFPQRRHGDYYLVEYPAAAKPELKERILVLTHIDTVWPVGKISKMPFYISGQKVFGPGVLDMKAGLVMILFALKALHVLNIPLQKKVAVFINTAEETGSEASAEMIKNLSRRSAFVLCLEPALPGGALKTRRKGRLVIRLEARGKAAHSGTPEKGINAVEELIGQLLRLKKLATQGMTMSIGQIEGGEKANIIPECAWAVMDIRFWSLKQKDKVLSALKNIKPSATGAKIKYSVESYTPPMEKTKASASLLGKVKRIAAFIGVSLEDGRTGGGSDASFASSLGVPTLDGMGPDGEGIHAEDEHLLLPSLVSRTALLTEILRRL